MKYDVDLEVVREGYVFGVGVLSRVINTSPLDRLYPRNAQAFIDWLHQQLRAAGRPLTVCFDHDTVRVLTHSEATKHNNRRYHNDVSRAKRDNRRMRDVDITALTYEEAEEHRRNLTLQNAELQGLRAGRRAFRQEYAADHPATPRG